MTVYAIGTVAEGDLALEDAFTGLGFFANMRDAENERVRRDIAKGGDRIYRMFEMKTLATLEVLDTLTVERRPTAGVTQPPHGPRIYAVGFQGSIWEVTSPEDSYGLGGRYRETFIAQDFCHDIRAAESVRWKSQSQYGEEDGIWLIIAEQIIVAEIVIDANLIMTRIPNAAWPELAVV